MSPSVEAQLQELDALGAALPDAEARAEVRRYLGNRSNVVVARAAKLLVDATHTDAPDPAAEAELTEAFHRFLANPVKTDPGCMAKLAVVEALRALDRPDPGVFRVGLRHVQLEPTWGGRSDTAAPLRAACALGLVEAGADGVLDELAVLLADPEPDARVGAARALAACGPLATPLLRYKALAIYRGDPGRPAPLLSLPSCPPAPRPRWSGRRPPRRPGPRGARPGRPSPPRRPGCSSPGRASRR